MIGTAKPGEARTCRYDEKLRRARPARQGMMVREAAFRLKVGKIASYSASKVRFPPNPVSQGRGALSAFRKSGAPSR